MADPLVSVVIPAFNRERYIGDAVASVLSQGYESLEVIVVDDGSSDGTLAAARRFPGVRCIGRAHGGAAAARNTGVAAARGDLLAFLDSDDLWTEGMLRRRLAAIGGPSGAAAAFGWVRQFVSPELADDVRAALACPSAPAPGRCCGTLLVTREAMEMVGPFDETMGAGEFIDWYSRAAGAGVREVMVEDVVLLRRLHAANLGFRRPELRLELVRAVGNHLRRRGPGRDQR
jgi:glycosyltransferase involved in cell wall biosynthesis